MDLPHLTPVFGRHEFLIRRLHSLLGVVPLSGYLAFHLATNASIMDGLDTYQRRADQIHVIGPTTLLILEWSLILLPILVHGILGVLIVARGKRNYRYYPYRENIRYSLERMTGVIAFVFILWHVFHVHGWFHASWWLDNVARPLGGAKFDPRNVVTAAMALQASMWIWMFYLIGTLAVVYHMANGLWTAGITWGLWTTPNAQRWANVPCLLVGLALAIVGVGAIGAMLNLPLPQAVAILLGLRP